MGRDSAVFEALPAIGSWHIKVVILYLSILFKNYKNEQRVALPRREREMPQAALQGLR
jgi:hypothetical protein